MDLPTIIHETLKDIEENKKEISNIIQRCIRIAYMVDDWENVIWLKRELLDLSDENVRKEYANDAKKILEEAGCIGEQLKSKYDECITLKSYLNQRKVVIVNKDGNFKEGVIVLSLPNIESKIKLIKQQINEIDKDKQFLSQVDILCLTNTKDNYESIIDRFKAKVYEYLIGLEKKYCNNFKQQNNKISISKIETSKDEDMNENNEELLELEEEEEEKNQGLDEIPDNERQVFIDKDQMSIFELKRRKDRGDIDLHPPYQRKDVWTTVKKSKLIESVLRSISVPAIYLAEKKDGTREVIDGQQRLLSFFNFLDNHYELNNLPVLKHLNGKKFKYLESQDQRKIEDYQLHIFIIKKESHPDIKFDVFQRINQGATMLNAQEIRQCIYRGDGITLIKKMASNSVFKEIIERTNLQVSKLKDEELVLRFLSFYLKEYQSYKGNLNSFLNDTLENFDLFKNISDNSDNIETVFDKTIKDIKLVFGDKPFTITKDGRDNKKLNSSLFDILTVSFARYDSSVILQNKEIVLEEFNKLMKDIAFYNSITSGNLTKTNVKLRFEKWFNVLEKIMGGKSDAQ